MSEVTIVIPVYKPQSSYLLEMFDSICSQHFSDFNIVISDDDDDRALVMDCIPSALSSRIMYVQNHGTKGIFGNLNNALQLADTPYIQIFCQDDVMLPTLIHSNYKTLESHPEADLVFTHFDFITESGLVRTFDRKDIGFIPRILKPGEANNFFLYFGCMPGNLSSVMFRRKMLDQIGLFNELYAFAGDYEFWVRASQHHTLVFSKGTHLYVRDHPQNASKLLGTFKRFIEIKHIHKYLIEHNTIPVAQITLQRYVNIHVFRSIASFIMRKYFLLKRSEWKEVKEILDGKPYSFWISLLTFFRPVSREIHELANYMEVTRD